MRRSPFAAACSRLAVVRSAFTAANALLAMARSAAGEVDLHLFPESPAIF
jgi:hypothetical protein